MRISTIIVLFVVFTNAGALMLQTTGAADVMGINAETGADDEVQEAQNAAKAVDTGNAAGGTLFAMYNSLLNTVEAIFTAISPAAQIMSNIGVPTWFTSYLFSGMTIVTAVDIISWLRGSDL
jgi:hypothetical protein